MATQREILESKPVGYRFKPNDVELVDHYLKRKILGEPLFPIIAEIELCKHEPWDLPHLSVVKSEDEWFFFCPRKNKYLNSTRSDRATEAGFWKVTGKGREIKIRGEVIGTKKTLVFYTGRVPNGVKTNWVIHEYHITFPPKERTFVVCRLMNKTETKKTENQGEERSNALIYDEEQPSNHAASDYENQASVDRIPDFYSLPEENMDSNFQGMPQAVQHELPSFQQYAHLTEQEASLQNSPLPSTNFGNETTEEEDNFFKSLFAVRDVYYSEERQQTFVNDSIPSESLIGPYYESSDTDAEIVSRFGNVLDSSTACNRYAGSKESQVMKMVKTSQGAARTRAQLASNRYASSPSPPRRSSPVSVNSAQNVASRRQLHRKASRKEKSKDEDQKEAATVESGKDQTKAQVASSRKNLETARDQSSGVNKDGSFIHLETPLSSKRCHDPLRFNLFHFNSSLFFLNENPNSMSPVTTKVDHYSTIKN